jgi:hypothetical protein
LKLLRKRLSFSLSLIKPKYEAKSNRNLTT